MTTFCLKIKFWNCLFPCRMLQPLPKSDGRSSANCPRPACPTTMAVQTPKPLITDVTPSPRPSQPAPQGQFRGPSLVSFMWWWQKGKTFLLSFQFVLLLLSLLQELQWFLVVSLLHLQSGLQLPSQWLYAPQDRLASQLCPLPLNHQATLWLRGSCSAQICRLVCHVS